MARHDRRVLGGSIRPRRAGLVPRLALLAAAVIALLGVPTLVARAQPAGSSPDPASGGAAAEPSPGDGAGGAAVVPDGAGGDGSEGSEQTDEKTISAELQHRIDQLHVTALRLHRLVHGVLSPTVDPDELFLDRPLSLSDDDAVNAERERIVARMLLPQASEEQPEAPGTGAPSGTPVAVPDDGVDDAQSAPSPPEAPLSFAQQKLLDAMLLVEEGRLAFLSLPKAKRDALLAEHAERRVAHDQALAEAQQQLSEAQQRADDAAAERAQAEADLERAQTNAARSAFEARVALLETLEAQAALETRFLEAMALRSSLMDKGEALATRTKDVDERIARAEPPAEDADALYDEVTSYLRDEARPELDRRLSALSEGELAPRPNELALDPGVGDSARAELVELADRARRGADELDAMMVEARRDAATDWNHHVIALNRSRLKLLRALSVDKRADVSGFSPAGLSQAEAELAQMRLILRYHVLATLELVDGLQSGEVQTGIFSTLAIVEILFFLALFWWWRRKAPSLVTAVRRWLEGPEQSPFIASRAYLRRSIKFVLRVRSPLEWLLLVLLVYSTLPAELQGLLEVRLPLIALGWIIGGSLAVAVVDALFARSARESETAALRLRTFRLIGRVVTSFGLVLALSAELVGKGTIYGWVWSVCWFSAIPVVFVIVRWWRAIVFERIEARKRRSKLAGWVAANQSGLYSSVAAFVGGVYVLGVQVSRLFRSYVTGFEATRRLLAYLFRREMSQRRRVAEVSEDLELPTAEVLAALDPHERPGIEAMVHSPVDDVLAALEQAVDAESGGVVALVGERGLGKTTVLETLASRRQHVVYVRIEGEDEDAIVRALEGELGQDWREQLEHEGYAVIVDDAHRLLTPAIGGLSVLDRALTLARELAKGACWIFAFNAGGFRFLERARGARPLFDEVQRLRPFREEEVGELVRLRLGRLGIAPSFEELVTEPAAHDEVDRKEQLDRAEQNYYRLLWDYAAGNPIIALYYLRDSLRVHGDETRIVVFGQPEMDDLEALPDNFAFALRAVLQLEPCSFERAARATRLSARIIDEALRYGTKRGYLFVDDAGHYRIETRWLRAVLSVLRRRHLIGKIA